MRTALSRILACYLFLLALSGVGYAKTLYAFELYNTLDPTAGSYIRTAGDRISAFLTEAVQSALNPGDVFVRHRFDGNKFSIDDVRTIINPLGSFGAEDVVLFFYIGHGLADPKSNFQLLQIEDKANNATQYAAEKVVEVLASRQPKTLIAVFEACNVEPIVQPPMGGAEASYDIKKIRDILTTRGGIAIATAKKGQYSFITSHGGVFTSRFLDFFRIDSGVNNFEKLKSEIPKPLDTGAELQPQQEPWIKVLW